MLCYFEIMMGSNFDRFCKRLTRSIVAGSAIYGAGCASLDTCSLPQLTLIENYHVLRKCELSEACVV